MIPTHISWDKFSSWILFPPLIAIFFLSFMKNAREISDSYKSKKIIPKTSQQRMKTTRPDIIGVIGLTIPTITFPSMRKKKDINCMDILQD